MRLHRIKLVNYRGVAEREVVFSPDGVTVVEGPNEAGKSSMVEALDLLFEAKDSSKTKQVRAVSPRGKDVAPLVEAEVETGPYRFVYTKQWLKRPATSLSVLAPKREQLTGEAAHERASAMLSATVDLALWKALRMLQTARDQMEVDGCPALLKALDAASGPVTLTGTETTLLGRIEEELRRYYTPGGKPSGEYREAKAELQSATEALEQVEAVFAQHESDLDRHEALTAQARERRGRAEPVQAELGQAQAAVHACETLASQVALAKERAARAAATAQAAARGSQERAGLVSRAQECAEAVARSEAARAAAQAEQESALRMSQEAQSRHDELRRAAQLAGEALAAARRAQEQARFAAELAAAKAASDAAAAADRRRAAAKAKVGLAFVVGLLVGAVVGFVSGQWPIGAAAAAVVIALGWWLGSRSVGPAVVAPARAEGPEVDGSGTEGPGAGDPIPGLQAKAAGLEAELASAKQQCVSAQETVTQAQVRVGVAVERAGSAHAELAAARGRLEQAREALSDSAAQEAAAESQEAARAAQASLGALSADLANTDAAKAGARLAAAKAAAAAHAQESAVVERELTAVTARLEVGAGAGYQERFDLARTRHEQAQEEFARISDRAAGAKLLWETVTAHRDAARSRYAAPLERAVADFGKTVFGPSFEVALDGQLRIDTRTLNGVTLDFDSLSEGAKEQMSMLVRLACAKLVDPVEGAPVVIDDALGHSDPQRLAKMRDALAASTGQVIVLTCFPERFANIGKTIRL